jgi:hypothetical protein
MESMEPLVFNSSVCTLAVGEKYSNTASAFLSSLPPEIKKYCLTDFTSLDFGNTNVIKFQDDLTPIWQQKRCVIKEAIKGNEAAIFIDADYKYIGTPLTIELSPFEVTSWQIVPMPNQTCWRFGKLNPVMEGLSKILGISDWTKTTWVAPNLFRIKADEKTHLFFEAWDKISFYLREHKYKINDGISIGLAAYAAGYVPMEDPGLLKLHQDLKHLFFGTWYTDGSMT